MDRTQNRSLRLDCLRPEDEELLFLIKLSKKLEQRKQELKTPQVRYQQDIIWDGSLFNKQHLRDQRLQ